MDYILKLFNIPDIFLGITGAVTALYVLWRKKEKVTIATIIGYFFFGVIGSIFLGPAACRVMVFENCDLIKIVCAGISLPFFSAIITVGSSERISEIMQTIAEKWSKK